MNLFLSLVAVSLGSFLATCAYRIPRQISIVTPGSFCPSCKQPLQWYALVPVCGYVISRGRCLHCHHPISWKYPAMELLVLILSLSLFQTFGPTTDFICALFFVLTMILIAFIDAEHLLIPNVLIVVGVLVGLCYFMVFDVDHLLARIAAGILSAGSLLLIRQGGNLVLKKETMGLGDVKLGALVGLFLMLDGFLIALWLASMTGLIAATLSRSLRVWSKDQRLPFGSFLGFSAILISLFPEQIKGWILLWWT